MAGKKNFFIFIFLVLFSSIFFSQINQARASQVSAPTILEADGARGEVGLGQFYIKGLTEANTEVLIYIDGKYFAMAQTGSQGNETDSFYYRHRESLLEGKHIITVISRDKVSLVLSPPVEIELIIPRLPAPTLINPTEETVTAKVKPFITGLTVSSSFVHIYIDGIYNGRTTVVSHQSGTADFIYKPFLNLSLGWHETWAIAEDQQGKKSGISNVLKFHIEEPMPAPVLITPAEKLENNVSYNHPIISGLAKNDSAIKVYIDHKLDGQFQVVNHQSGTASFSYQSFQLLTRGNHLVYTTAVDDRGKESIWSNIINFTVRQPAIAQIAQEEKKDTVAKIKEPAVLAEEPVAVISPTGDTASPLDELAQKEKLAGEITDNDIKELIEETVGAEEKQSGLIDESEAGQSKLKLNLLIFIAFLLAVIVWILWVNKELIKERRVKNKEKLDQKDQDNPPANNLKSS